MTDFFGRAARFLRSAFALGEANRTTVEQQFRVLAENLPTIIVRYDRNGRRTYVNTAHERFTGVPAEAVIGKSPRDQWLLPTGPAEANAFEKRLLMVLDTGKPEAWEQTWVDEQQRVVCLDVRAMPEFNRSRRPVGVLAVARDISSKREMEQSLRLATGVFQTSHAGIMITDSCGHIVDVNPGFELISGYSRDEVVGQRPSLLSSGRHSSDFYTEMWSVLKSQGVWEGEVINRRKCGEIYTERLGITPVRDSRGVVSHYVGVFSDISQTKSREKRLQYLAYHDALTGLPNRLLLADRMRLAIAQAERANGLLGVLYLDLDGFKPINDRFGHQTGDRVLVEVARRISAALRASDTVARIGGDEFVALVVDPISIQECTSVARRILIALSEPMEMDRLAINLSASIGISVYPDDHSEPDTLLRYADQAMYSAKCSGRNNFVLYNSENLQKAGMNRG